MIACAVALVLLLDASASIRADEWRLQVEGHAASFEAPEVQAVIEREGVAVTALAFADHAAPMVGWRHLRTAADARSFAAELRQAPPGGGAGTDIGAALHAGLRALSDAPCQADQEVLDLVTDGEANPVTTQQARAYAEAQGVRINALGVGSPEAAEWLREHAVTPGGFAASAADWRDFGRAIRRKITLELAGLR